MAGLLSDIMANRQLDGKQKFDILHRSFSTQEREEAEQRKFDLSTYGGEAEIQAMILKYEEEGEVSEDRKAELLKHLPPEPKFEVLTEEAYGNLSAFKQRKYNNDVASYRKKKAKWYKSEKGTQMVKAVYGIAKDQYGDRGVPALASGRDAMLIAYQGQGLYQYSQEFKEDPLAWEEEFKRLHGMKKTSPQYKAEKEIAKVEHKMATLFDHDGAQALHDYSGDYFTPMNRYMRTKEGTPETQEKCEQLKSVLRRSKLSRDLVCRRAVGSYKTAAKMLGVDPTGLTAEQVRGIIEQAMATAEGNQDFVTLTEDGFVSTSLPGASTLYEAGCINPDHPEIGIEFFILAKKGTQALNINVAGVAAWGDGENELLMNAGTKFRLVKAVFDPPAQGQSNVMQGHAQSWKFYLETVPEEEQGIRRTTASSSQPASDAQ